MSCVLVVATLVSVTIVLHGTRTKPKVAMRPIFVLAANDKNGVSYEYDGDAIFNNVVSKGDLEKYSRDLLVQELGYKNWDDYMETMNKNLFDSGYKNWDEYYRERGFSDSKEFLQKSGGYDSMEEMWEYQLRNPVFDSAPEVMDIENEFGSLPVFMLEICRKDWDVDTGDEFVTIPSFADGGINNKNRKFAALPRWQSSYESRNDDCVLQLWGWCTGSEDYIIKIMNQTTSEVVLIFYINVCYNTETGDYTVSVIKKNNTY